MFGFSWNLVSISPLYPSPSASTNFPFYFSIQERLVVGGGRPPGSMCSASLAVIGFHRLWISSPPAASTLTIWCTSAPLKKDLEDVPAAGVAEENLGPNRPGKCLFTFASRGMVRFGFSHSRFLSQATGPSGSDT